MGPRYPLIFPLLFTLTMPLAACGAGQPGEDGCASDKDCDDGLGCNGSETCVAGACRPGQAVECPAHARCSEPHAECICDAGYSMQGQACIANACGIPSAPAMSVIHAGAELEFEVPGGKEIQVGTSADPQAAGPDAWSDSASLVLPAVQESTRVRVFARIADPDCPDPEVFAFTYQVQPLYPPAAGEEGSPAVAADDEDIVGWATGVEDVSFGAEVDDQWRDSEAALGPAEETASGIVSLGRGGSITLSFDPPIADGPGFDLAVFENGFTDDYLELGLVEVSSDGANFLRFAHAYLGEEPVDSFGLLDTTLVGSLAGKYRRGFGTPFDLAVFTQTAEVREGVVDLQAIRYVRIVDVVGNGETPDSFGHAIFDPYPTEQSAGFDLDAVAVLNAGK